MILLHDPENIEITTEYDTYKGWFFDERIDKNNLPEDHFVYEIRGGDEEDFCTLEPNVWVNFTGTFVTKTPVKLEDIEDDRYVEITGYEFI